jgi:hypothetical protein
VDAGGGSGGGGLYLGGGWAVGVCRQCTCTTDGFGLNLLGAVGLLDIGGVCVYVGLESPNDMAHGSGGGAGCFPLDIGGVETCLAFEEDCLEIQGSKLSCNWGMPGKLANLSVAEVIACFTDRSNLSTLAVSSSDLL